MKNEITPQQAAQDDEKVLRTQMSVRFDTDEMNNFFDKFEPFDGLEHILSCLEEMK